MLGRTRIIAVTIVLWLAAGALGQDFRPPEEQPVQGVALLKNGQVLEGRISRMGNFYSVVMPDSEIRLKVADVDYVCRSLEEGYQRKQAAAQPGSFQDRVQLAQWCERHGLLGAAANEIAIAATIEPNHPTICLVQRRLQLAIESKETPDEQADAGSRGPSSEDLDHMVRGMPPGTVEMFAQTVQPILMNHCMTSGCHGPQSDTKLQLLRVSPGQPPGRRVTQRNLHAVLEWVNRDNPAASRLLTAPSGPHGSLKAPIFTDHHVAQSRKVVDWIYRVAQKPSPITPDIITIEAVRPGFDDLDAPRIMPPRGHVRQMPRPGGTTGAVRHAGANMAADKESGKGAEASTDKKSSPTSNAHPATKRRPLTDGAALGAKTPAADPFDPEQFNRGLAPHDGAAATAMPTPAAALRDAK